MRKLLLYIQIKKFYKTFADIVGDNFITKLSEMTTDNVMSVTFDIDEVLIGYIGFETLPIYSWLTKLERRCLLCKC